MNYTSGTFTIMMASAASVVSSHYHLGALNSACLQLAPDASPGADYRQRRLLQLAGPPPGVRDAEFYRSRFGQHGPNTTKHTCQPVWKK